MVSQEQIKENRDKLEALWGLIFGMMTKHDQAMYTYQIGEESKHLPDEDITVLIEDYKKMKVECQSKFKELL